MGSAQAAESLARFVDEFDIAELGSLVVTDTKLPQSPDSVTQKISVLRAEEIENTPGGRHNLAELLRYTSGQFVNVLSRDQANWGSYGGLGPKYNSYLLDGVPMDSFVDAMAIDPAIIDRVEVHKGPASVLYSNYLTMDFFGNETPLAGTTNFVLKNRVEETRTTVLAGAGSWGAYRGQLYHQGRQGDLSYYLGATQENAQYTQVGDKNTWLQTTESPNYTRTQIFANLHYALNDPQHTVSLLLHHADRDGDQGRPNRDYHHQYDTLNFAYNNRISQDVHLQFKLGERRYDRGFANDNYDPKNPATSNLLLNNYETTRQNIRPMDLSLGWRHGEHNLLTLGVDHQTVHYWTQERSPAGLITRKNDATASSTGVFLQEKVQWDRWVFRAGVRHNRIVQNYELLGGAVPTTTNSEWRRNLWSVGARYNYAADLAFYGNAGTSFMPPTAKQIGGIPGTPGNAGLQPESGLGQDLGADWQLNPTLSLGGRVFAYSIENAIVQNASGSTSSFQNASKINSQGVELDLRYAPSSNTAWFANLTQVHSTLQIPNDANQNNAATPFVPSTLFNLGAALKQGAWQVSPYIQWVGRYYDNASRTDRQAYGDFAVVNVRVQYALRPGVQLFADLMNLTDRRYAMPFDFRDPGINMFAGVRLSY